MKQFRISKSSMGAFIDAVYAIAVTILALEIPAEIDGEPSASLIIHALLNYLISFSVLFALWVQHRSLNEHIENNSPTILWLNALVLMLVCLIPRATAFVFDYGGNVTLAELGNTIFLGGDWTLPELVDLAYVGLILLADLGLLMLFLVTRSNTDSETITHAYRSKFTTSVLLILILATSLILPIENRYFLVLLPILLMTEHRVTAIVQVVVEKLRGSARNS